VHIKEAGRVNTYNGKCTTQEIWACDSCDPGRWKI